ncbi:ABC transporter ATP-binding protein [Actinokineospora sp. HUAS TT18]|uniref:ABC transporter ATP-binding protein n=1 Tax=Actinokineospora sp. HUAS TT18 TaxID=3447451 RepID=UPI003F5286E3
MLRVEGVGVRYGTVPAVSDVDIEVADGEVVALLGPSGCGKSTLLRAVAGLEPLASGAIAWNGGDLAGVPVHKRGFGLVFQDGQLFPHRDVAANIAFGLRMRGDSAPGRVDDLLDLVGLAGYNNRRVTELSGGEQQRVALARALAPRPRLLLLDEPLSALDRVLREQLAIDLARVLRTERSTAIVVTHDHDEAFTLADRVAVMRSGRIVQTGRPDEVWRLPADDDTARFLGCGLIIDGTVRDGALTCEFGTVTLPWAPAGDVRLGLRPTALRVGDGPTEGTVAARVHRRDHVRLVVDTPRRTVDAVAAIADAPDVGDPVRLVLDPDGLAVLSRRD